MPAPLALRVILSAVDGLSPALAGAAGKLKGLELATKRLEVAGAKLQGFGRGTALAGAGILAGAAGVVKSYLNAESAGVDLENAFRGVNGVSASFASLKKQIAEAGDVLPGTQEDFIRLAVALKKAGLDAETMAAGGFKAASQLQVLFGLSPEEGGRQFVAMAKSMGVAGEDLGAFADVLQRVTYASGVTLQELSDALPKAGSQLKALGIQGLGASKLVLTMLGALKETGVQGESAGVAVGQMLQKLATVSLRFENANDARGVEMKAAIQALASQGIKLDFFGKDGKFLGAENMMAQLTKLRGLSDEQKLLVSKLFGTQGARVVMTLLNDANFNKTAEGMASQESLTTRFLRKLGTLGAQLEALGGTSISAIRKIGEAMKPVLVPLFARLNQIVGKVSEWISANPRLVGGLALAATALGGLMVTGGGAAWGLGKVVSTASTLLPVLGKVGAALGVGGAGGLLPVVGALAAAAAVLAWTGISVARNWDLVAPALADLGVEVRALMADLDAATAPIREFLQEMGLLEEGGTLLGLAMRITASAVGNMVSTLAFAVSLMRMAIAAAMELAYVIGSHVAPQFAALEAFRAARAGGAGVGDAVGAAAGAAHRTREDYVRRVAEQQSRMEAAKAAAVRTATRAATGHRVEVNVNASGMTPEQAAQAVKDGTLQALEQADRAKAVAARGSFTAAPAADW